MLPQTFSDGTIGVDEAVESVLLLYRSNAAACHK